MWDRVCFDCTSALSDVYLASRVCVCVGQTCATSARATPTLTTPSPTYYQPHEFCGDGIKNNGTNEECDDGNSNNLDLCSNDCKINRGGDIALLSSTIVSSTVTTLRPTSTPAPLVCEAGMFADAGSSACTACPAGKYKPMADTDTVCRQSDCRRCFNCDPGRYAAGTASTRCTDCEVGKYLAASGVNTACNNCEAGKYGPWRALPWRYQRTNTVCDNCVAGTFSADVGATGASTCVTCGAGTYSEANAATVCTHCLAGKYKAAAAWMQGRVGQCVDNNSDVPLGTQLSFDSPEEDIQQRKNACLAHCLASFLTISGCQLNWFQQNSYCVAHTSTQVTRANGITVLVLISYRSLRMLYVSDYMSHTLHLMLQVVLYRSKGGYRAYLYHICTDAMQIISGIFTLALESLVLGY